MLPVYQAGEALRYVTEQGWQHRNSGDELCLKNCPFCGRADWRFFINNTTGLFKCHHASCDEKGNFYLLKRGMGDLDPAVRPLKLTPPAPAKKPRPLADIAKYEAALAQDQDGLRYLVERGLTIDTAQAWHLGLKQDENGVKWLMIPYVVGGQIVDVKYRSLPPAPKAYRRLGGESILFGGHELLPTKGHATLYLVEGELDALTLWQRGYRPVVSTTTGAGGFKPEWYDAIKAFDPETIIVCYDNDPAGQKGAANLIKKFDDRRVLNVELADAKDVNEFFTKHDNKDFDDLIIGAQPTEVENVYSCRSVLNDLETQLFLGSEAFEGVQSQFTDINDMIAGGYWNGQLVTLSGTSGTGKTSFVLQELHRFATQGIPSYLLCLEMPRMMIMRKLIEHRFNIPMLKLTLENVQNCRRYLEPLPLYFGDSIGDLDDVERTIRAAVKRYDLKILAFDNLNYFVRSTDRVTQEIARVTKRMKELAVDLNIPIIMIAQPRKFDDDTRIMTMNDLKDSVAVAQDSDTVILLYRRKRKTDAKDVGKSGAAFQGNQSPYTLVRVDKARYAAGGETYLYFSGDISTFRPLTPEEKDAMTNHG